MGFILSQRYQHGNQSQHGLFTPALLQFYNIVIRLECQEVKRIYIKTQENPVSLRNHPEYIKSSRIQENQWQPVVIHGAEPTEFSGLAKVSLQKLSAGKSID